MRMLPRARLTIVSSLSPDQVGVRLAEAIGPRPTSLFNRSTKPFWGRIGGSSFDVMRSTQGRNSFRPRIRGSIEAADHGSRVLGTMRLHEMVLGFLAFIILVPGWAFLSIAGGSLLKGGPDSTALIAVGVLLLFVGLVLGSFWMESRQALRVLSEVVDASHSELS